MRHRLHFPGNLGRRLPRVLFILSWLVFATGHAFGEDYYWNKAGGGNFNTGANWTPTRPTTNTADDVLHFENGGTYTVTDIPNQTVAQLLVSNNTNVTFTSSAFATFTLAGDGNAATTDFLVGAGSTLNMTIGSIFTLRHNTNAGNLASIAGNFYLDYFGGFGQVIYTTNTSADVVTTVTGVLKVVNGAVQGSAASLVFESGAVYEHATNISNNAIPLATWQAGSTAKVTGPLSTAPGNLSQAFYDLEWNCPSQASHINLAAYNPSVAGTFKVVSTASKILRLNSSASPKTLVVNNFLQTGGTLDLNDAAGATILQVSGSFTKTGGTLTETGPGTGHAIEFNGNTTQTVTGGTVSNTIGFRLNNPSGVDGVLTLNTGTDLTISSGALGSLPVFTGSNGLVYNGTVAQTVGKEWQVSIARLTINNAAGVVANGSLSVTEALNLSNGNLVLGSTSTLTLGANASSTGTYNYTAGRVVGKLKRWVAASTGSREFHIGTLTDNRKVTVNYTAAPTTGGTITTEFIPGDPGTGGLPMLCGSITISEVANTGYWSVEAGDGLLGGTYTITLDASGFTTNDGGAITDLSGIRPIKRPTGGNWADEGVSVQPANLNALSISGLGSFSQFGVGGAAGVLPVELTGFWAQPDGPANRIEWETASETMGSHFLVETSTDGRNWLVVSELPAAGKAAGYQVFDEKPACLAYYRLWEFSPDGVGELLATELAERPCGSGFGVKSFYPQPAHDLATLEVELPRAGAISVRLFDTAGKVFFAQVFEKEEGLVQVPLDLSGLPAGVYTVQVSDGVQLLPQKLVKW